MSSRATRRLLWIAALAIVPLPMLQFHELAPVTRYLLLAGVVAGLMWTEGTGTIPWIFFGLMLGHALVYAGLLWTAAWALARGLRALAPSRAGALALLLVAGGVILTLAFDVYRTPFAAESLHANLWTVLR
jgi:hypothetical protein